MGATDVAAQREAVTSEPEPARESPQRAPAGPAAMALELQHAAGNRATARWASGEALQRRPAPKPKKPKDPLDIAIAMGRWLDAADILSDRDPPEIETRIKALKAKQREKLMQAVRERERLIWADPVIEAMEAIDLRSANVGSLRWAKASGFIARAGGWFKGLKVEDARKVAHELGFSRDQLKTIIGADAELAATFKDPWAYVPKDERMLYVMNLLVDTHGYAVGGAAGIVGNLAGESSLIPSRVEGSTEWSPTRTADFKGKTSDWSDDQIRDRNFKTKTGPKLPGVGLAQWTTKERREGFFARPEGTALLYDMDGQVAYLVDELASSFASLDKKLRKPQTTVQAAADAFLEQFERPKDPEASRSARRNSAARAAKLYADAHAAPAVSPAAPPG